MSLSRRNLLKTGGSLQYLDKFDADFPILSRWTGQIDGQGKEGLFPASYVKLL
jgi:hypothetical protein